VSVDMQTTRFRAYFHRTNVWVVPYHHNPIYGLQEGKGFSIDAEMVAELQEIIDAWRGEEE